MSRVASLVKILRSDNGEFLFFRVFSNLQLNSFFETNSFARIASNFTGSFLHLIIKFPSKKEKSLETSLGIFEF